MTCHRAGIPESQGSVLTIDTQSSALVPGGRASAGAHQIRRRELTHGEPRGPSITTFRDDADRKRFVETSAGRAPGLIDLD